MKTADVMDMLVRLQERFVARIIERDRLALPNGRKFKLNKIQAASAPVRAAPSQRVGRFRHTGPLR